MGISIGIEGSEGAGKSLLKVLTYELLTKTTSLPVLPTREPGGPDLSEMIRSMFLKSETFKNMHPVSNMLLYTAARVELFFTVEKPFLERNPYGVLIKDREWLSTKNLQSVDGVGPEYIDAVQQPFTSIPDRFVIIDIPVPETVVRMETASRFNSNREVDWRDTQTQENLERIRQNYLLFVSKNRERCILMDCFDDPWVKAGQIKLEVVKSFARWEGKAVDSPELSELLDIFQQEAKSIVDEDSEKDILWQTYGIDKKRKEVEDVRIKMGYPNRDELRARMHEEWMSLGLEGFSSGIERGK